jgi:hypothetical protein
LENEEIRSMLRKNLSILVVPIVVVLISLSAGLEAARFGEDGQLKGDNKKTRIREGTRVVEQLGYFQATGDRSTFHSADGKIRIVGLENLILERISRISEETPGKVEWNVSGTITEFRGNNFLLVSRAVLRSNVAK